MNTQNYNIRLFILINLILLLDIIIYQLYLSSLKISLIFLIFVLEVIIYQSIFLKIVTIIKKQKIFYFLSSFLIALNVFSLKLVNYKLFMTQSLWHQSLIFIILLVFFYYLLVNLEDKKRNQILCILLMSTILSSISIVASNNTYEKKEINFIHDELLPRFNTKPNIYLIGIDGLITEEMANKLHNYNLNENNSENSIHVPNSFAPKIPTALSWGNILSLSQKGMWVNQFAFSGQSNSLLFEIFRKNNYHITSGFTTLNMGTEAGNYVDEFHFYESRNDEFRQSTSCMDLSKIFTIIPKYYGLCSIEFLNHANSISTLIGFIFKKKSLPINLFSSEEDFIKNLVNKKVERPRLFVYHTISYTRHTPYNYEQMSDAEKDNWSKFYNNKLKEAYNFINSISEIISNNDPNSIVLFFGDHGTFVDRKALDNQNKALSKEQIYDLYGIDQIYLKTQSQCIDKSTFRLNYTTTSREIANIIFCLADDKNIVSKLFNKFDDTNKSGFDVLHDLFTEKIQ